MIWEWTEHCKRQIVERNLSVSMVNETLSAPDTIMDSNAGRKIYQKLFGERLVRVITEGTVIITAYATSKINKYMGG